MKNKKKLILDDISEDEEDSKKPANILNSEFTQLLTDEIKFLKDGIYIDTKGLQINDKRYSMNFKNEIIVDKCIGTGSAAKVEKIHLKSNTTKFYAMKTISVYKKENRVQLLNDLKNYIISQGDCPFLLKFYGCFFETGNVSIVLEYMQEGDLKSLIEDYQKRKIRIPEWLIKRIIEQTLHGLAFIHNINHQIHLDLKPENILLSKSRDVKISDFGIAKALDFTNANAKTFIGTLFYMSPERLANLPYTTTADIWSLGIILLEMVMLKYPFNECRSYIELLQYFNENTIEAKLKKAEGFYSKNLYTFIKLCLRMDSKKRPFAIDLLSHKWFFD